MRGAHSLAAAEVAARRRSASALSPRPASAAAGAASAACVAAAMADACAARSAGRARRSCLTAAKAVRSRSVRRRTSACQYSTHGWRETLKVFLSLSHNSPS